MINMRKKQEVKSKILGYLKEAKKPITSLELTEELEINNKTVTAYLRMMETENPPLVIRTCEKMRYCGSQLMNGWNYAGAAENEIKRSAVVGDMLRQTYKKEIERMTERIKTLTETAKFDYEKRITAEKTLKNVLDELNKEQLINIIKKGVV